MAGDRSYSKKAAGKKMTLGELRAFVKECDGLGAAETSPIGGRISMGGGLKEVSSEIVRFGDMPEGQ